MKRIYKLICIQHVRSICRSLKTITDMLAARIGGWPGKYFVLGTGASTRFVGDYLRTEYIPATQPTYQHLANARENKLFSSPENIPYWGLYVIFAYKIWLVLRTKCGSWG